MWIQDYPGTASAPDQSTPGTTRLLELKKRTACDDALYAERRYKHFFGSTTDRPVQPIRQDKAFSRYILISVWSTACCVLIVCALAW